MPDKTSQTPKTNPSPLDALLHGRNPHPHSAPSSKLELPADMENYIMPKLWRDLQADNPRRGILINGLDQLRSVVYLLSTFLPKLVAQEKMDNPVSGLVKGEILAGSLLFSDVSGFTALSERLAALGPEGAERLTIIMNEYFAAMLEILAWSGGMLFKFAGDATLVYFPYQENNQQANWAARAAQRMMRALDAAAAIETPTGSIKLKMKIGIGTGDFLAASVGSAERMEYIVLGRAPTRTMTAEGKASAGQIIVDRETAVCLQNIPHSDLNNGFCLLDQAHGEELDDFEIQVSHRRRARSAVPWDSAPQEIAAEMNVALRQIKAIRPFIAAELADRVVARARERRVESEYRPTVSLFCNFTGPQKLIDQWGKQGRHRLAAILSGYFNGIHEIIVRYGGIISAIDPYSKGTKYLVLFGAPIAHEDDPQRAVNVALGMNAALNELNARWRRRYARHLPQDWDSPLIEQRMGITQGAAFAGQIGSSTSRQYTVMGDDVNLAVRLMDAAEMGQILTNKHVRDMIADQFATTSLPPIRVKGKSKPIPLFQVDGLREDTLARRISGRGRLVARANELARGRQLLGRLGDGRGAMLTIRGAVGIGKSHFADALLKQALAKGARGAFCHCRAYNAKTPYSGWAAIVGGLADITRNDDAEAQAGKLHALLAAADMPPEPYLQPLTLLMGLRPLLPADTRRRSERQSEQLPSSQKQLLDAIGNKRRKPKKESVWDLLEDRQTRLTDRQKAELLDALQTLFLRLAADKPLILFFENAHWLDTESRGLLAPLAGKTPSQPILIMLAEREEEEKGVEAGELIVLRPFSRRAANGLLLEELGALPEMVYRQSEGNPLFIKEIMNWLRRESKIETDGLENVRIADVFQELVLSRLDSLPENQREIVKIGAVIGNTFHHSEIEALLPRSIERSSLSSRLSDLVAARILIIGDAEGRYAYRQTLIHDALYNMLPFTQRRNLHAKMAVWLENHPGKEPLQWTESVSRHYEKARKWLELARFSFAAGQTAQEQKTYRAAMAYQQRALDALENVAANKEAQTLRLTVREALGDAALMAREYETAVAAYAIVHEKLPQNRRAAHKFALALLAQNRLASAEEIMRGVADEGQTAVSSIEATAIAWLLWRQGKAECGDWIAIAAAQEPPAPLRACLLEFGGDGDGAQALYRQLKMLDGAALTAVRRGDGLLRAGGYGKAAVCYQEAADLWQDNGNKDGQVVADYRQAELYWKMGKKKKARKTLKNALDNLSACSLTVQQNGAKIMHGALRATNGKRKSWPVWPLDDLDNAFRIPLFFEAMNGKFTSSE